MQFKIVIGLPDSVFAIVVKQFSLLEDFVRLDTSLRTSHIDCELFEKLLEKTKKENCSTKTVTCLPAMKWLKFRGLSVSVSRYCDRLFISDESTTYFDNVRNLSVLHCKEEDVMRFNNCSKLTVLSLNNLVWMTDSTFLLLLFNIVADQLTSLCVAGCCKLSGYAMVKVTEHCCSLLTINASFLPLLCCSAIHSFSNLSTLTSINFEDSIIIASDEEFNDTFLPVFRNNCSLRDVNIRNCGYCITSTIDILRLASCRGIVSLTLNNNMLTRVKDVDIVSLCALCPTIEELVVDELTCLTVNAFVCIGKMLKHLRVLSCCGLENSDIIADIIMEMFSSCTLVDFGIMRVEGVKSTQFEDISPTLRNLILLRNLNPQLTVSYTEWRRSVSMDAFHFCTRQKLSDSLLVLTIGRWPAGSSAHESSISFRMGELARGFQHLTELNFVDSNVWNDHLVEFVKYSTNRLAVLRFIRCASVSDSGVCAVIDANRTTLGVFSVEQCHAGISDKCFGSTSQCLKLRELTFLNQENITALGVRNFKKSACSYLEKLSIYRCHGCICTTEFSCDCYEYFFKFSGLS
jgi:hypothetical protein